MSASPVHPWAAKLTGPARSKGGYSTTRRCSVCGERGHSANSTRHNGADQAAVDAEVRAAELEAEEAGKFIRWTPGDDDGADGDTTADRIRARAPMTPSGRTRSATVPVRAPRRELRFTSLALVVVDDSDIPRPRTRGDCEGGYRPCPWISCSQHLFIDVNPDNGSIKLNHPGLEPWELAETCALDLADRGGATLEEVGRLVGVTRERIRQCEVKIVAKLRDRLPGIAEPDSPGPATTSPVYQEG